MPDKPTYEELEQRVQVLEQAESTFRRRNEGLDDSELWFQSLLGTINEGVILQAVSGDILAWNKKAEFYFGLTDIRSDDDKSSCGNLPLIHEDGTKCENKDHPFTITSQTAKPCVDQIMGVYRTPDDLRWISINTNPLFRKREDKPYAVVISFSDVTELKVEKDVSQNYLDVAGVIILALDVEGEITLINRKGCEILEESEKDRIGKKWIELFTPKEKIEEAKKVYKSLMEGRMDPFAYSELKIITRSGAEKTMAWHNTILKDKDGKIIGSLSSGEDITEKKEAVENIKESERQHRTIIQTAMDGFHLLDMQDNILEVNDAYCKMSGYTREELLKMKISDLEDQELSYTLVQKKQTVIENRESRFTSKHRRKDGSLFDVEISSQYQPEEERFVCFIRDITKQKKSEESLREREELLNRSQEMASVGSFVWDLRNSSLTWSRNMYTLHGTTESSFTGDLVDLSSQIMHPDDIERVQDEIHQMLKDNNEWDLEFRLVLPDGDIKNIRSIGIQEYDSEGAASKCFGVYQDITKRMLAEEKLRESEEKLMRSKKMESLGFLAGGVAHDLNNVLSGIVSYPELLLLNLPENSKYRKPIQTIQDSGMRAVAIVHDLLTIARGVATPKESLSLNDIIEEYKASPEYKKLKQYHPFVAVRTNLSKDLMNINGSPIHIRKVIMNLVSNASEAIEGKGSVLVSTTNRYVDRPIRGYEDVKTGEYAVLTVSDDGTGISPEYLEKIFEPFFTKKVMGRSGTGLGLAVVWNIVQDHEGYIDVSSNENGTIFELYFPIIRNKVSVKDVQLSIEDYKGNGESVLVVDDESSQREITCNMLEALGYKAEAVAGGEETVEYLRGRNVDIVLLDMIMNPGISGRETYERIIEIHPEQKAVIVSGYADTEDVKETQRLGAGRYIKKPLTLKKLGPAVKEELSKSR